MASCVNVLCPNGHRVTVKVTPTTSVLHIIEEVCKKKGFQPDQFDIKSEAGKVPIDVTLQLRYANLPNNAKLELIPAAKVRASSSGSGASVNISLQLPDGARLKPIDFPVDVSLWDVLGGFEKQEPNAVEAIARKGMEPVVVYMRDQICGENRLKATTLKALGLISGRGLLRLNHREKPAEEDMDQGPAAAASSAASSAAITSLLTSTTVSAASVDDPLAGVKLSDEHVKMIESISQGYRDYQRETTGQSDAFPSSSQTPVASSSSASAAASSFPMFPAPNRDFLPEMKTGASATSSRTPPPPVAVVKPQVMEFADFKFPESGASSSASDGASMDAKTLPDQSAEPCDRELQVFNLDLRKSDSSSEMMEVDDDFFELTIDDLRSRMSDLQRVASSEEPLLTAALRQKREEAKFAAYHRTLIRIHFPNRIVIQGLFRLRETVGAVYDFVSSNLASPGAFSLYVTPPRQDLKDKSATLMEAGLAPAAKVYFGPKGDFPADFLSKDCLKNLVEQPDLQCDVARLGRPSLTSLTNADRASSPTNEGKSTASAKRPTNEAGGKAAGASGGKMPKWFAAGKKK